MGFAQIFVLALIAMALGQLKRGRSLALPAASALVIYWLQPAQGSLSAQIPVSLFPPRENVC